MDKYHASEAPNATLWLALDEATRLDLVVNFVKQHEKDIETHAIRMHACIHVIVENQLAMESEPTPETYSRLLKQGLSRHEIIHAIGAVISEDMFDIMKGGDQTPLRYKNRLGKLTAKRWKQGKW